MRESLVLLQAIALLLLFGSSARADMDFLKAILEEDAEIWGRQLRRSSTSHEGSMSMPELSCVDESDCDERPCEAAECSAGVCVYTPKVCPTVDFCDTTDGVCRRLPNLPTDIGRDCVEASECSLSETLPCLILECIEGRCFVTDPLCPDDSDGDPCTEFQIGSRCGCNPDNKKCPVEGLVCDSSDGFCKDPADVN